MSFYQWCGFVSGLDAYMCSWPEQQTVQLECNYRNCPYIHIDRIVVSRLQGDMAYCSSLNAIPETRKAIQSCNYTVPHHRRFFGWVLPIWLLYLTTWLSLFDEALKTEICSEVLGAEAGVRSSHAQPKSGMTRNWTQKSFDCGPNALVTELSHYPWFFYMGRKSTILSTLLNKIFIWIS